MNPIGTVRKGSALLFMASLMTLSPQQAASRDFCWTNDEACGGADEGECESDCASKASTHCDGMCATDCLAQWTQVAFLDGDCSTSPYQAEFRCQCS